MAQTIHQAGQTPDPDAIRAAKDALEIARAERLAEIAPKLFADMYVPGPYSPDAGPVGKRSLGNAMLAVITRLDGGDTARAQFAEDANMTQSLAALSCLLKAGAGEEELAGFYTRWKDERLVLNKWFSLQAVFASGQDAPETVTRLAAHPDFDMGNPNRFRALFGGFASNAPALHRADGAGYRLLAEWLLKLDAKNPQTAARMTTAFSTWRRYDADRQAHAEAAMRSIAEAPTLSRDTSEMVTRLLG